MLPRKIMRVLYRRLEACPAVALIGRFPSADARRPVRSAGRAAAQDPAGGMPRLTVTLLRLVKLSSMPSSEHSRPMPLCFTPP